MPQQRRALIQRRKEMGLSRQALAREVGVTAATVATWERGSHSPHAYYLSPLAEALGVRIRQMEELLAATTEGDSQAVVDMQKARQHAIRVSKEGNAEAGHQPATSGR